jgi:hypothetical protein
MRTRLVSRFRAPFGVLFSSLLVLGGVLTVLPMHSDYETVAPQLYLTSSRGVTALNAMTGDEAFTADGAVASGDWRRLVSASSGANGTTVLRTVDGFHGDAVGDVSLSGTLDVRVVSFRGDLVALSPDARAVNGRQPGRASTKLVVASTTGLVPTRTYDLAANIEPEAFSTDGRTLFVVQYLPPMDPDRYQVRRMDLETGTLMLVPSIDGANQGQMPGIARTSVMAPDGRRLYTLYTSEDNGRRYSFVHVLDLQNQWAHCVDLPQTFGTDPQAMGIAIDPTASRVHVADVAAGKMAAIDTNRVALDGITRLKIRGVHARPAVAATTSRVYVAAQRNFVAMSAFSDITYFHSTLTSPARGLLAGPGIGPADEVYVAQRHAVVQLDSDTGRHVGSFAAESPSFTGLGYQYPPPTGDTYQCAC